MPNLKLMVVCFFGFLGGTFCQRLLEGSWFNADDARIIRALTLFTTLDIGYWKIPVVNGDFFTVGIPHLLKMDYSFFGGNGMFLQWGFYAFLFAANLVLLAIFLGVISSYFTGRK
jgi:hypothetical protein